MKIAIPIADGALATHFGHCREFAIVQVDDDSRKITGVEMLEPPPHEPGVLPRWLASQQANMIIAGGMGQRAQMLFAESGIDVFIGAPSLPPKALVEAFLEGSLTGGVNPCDH